jgi:hypothetical protein
VWLQIFCRDEAGRLSVDRVQRSSREGRVQRDRQRLSFARRQRTAQLTVAAASRSDLKSKPYEYRRDVAA